MIYNFKFTAHAYRNIQSIYDYISKNLYDPMSANRIMKMIQDSIENLKSFPYSAPAVKDDFLSRKDLENLLQKIISCFIKLMKMTNRLLFTEL